jgi:hypothetical protein
MSSSHGEKPGNRARWVDQFWLSGGGAALRWNFRRLQGLNSNPLVY